MLQWCTAWQAHTVAIATVVSYAMNISGNIVDRLGFVTLLGYLGNRACATNTLFSLSSAQEMASPRPVFSLCVKPTRTPPWQRQSGTCV